MARHRQWHVRGAPACLLAPIAIPIILLIKLAEVLGLKTSANLTAQDVEAYLQDFLDGRGGEWDWDDFTSIPITDPELEDIRRGALDVDLPLDDQGRTQLQSLLDRVRQLTHDG